MKRNIIILTTVIFAFIAPVFAAGYQYHDLKNSVDIPTIDEEEKKCLENTSVYEYPSCTQKDGIIYQTSGIDSILQLKKQYAMFLKGIYFDYYEDTEQKFN